MRDYMMALHQRFCKEPECWEVRKQISEAEQELHQKLDRRGQEQLLKLADLENELLDETSLESFLSGLKLVLLPDWEGNGGLSVFRCACVADYGLYHVFPPEFSNMISHPFPS